MPQFVVYEIWTRVRIIDAKDEHDAYDKGEPRRVPGLNLCNWHVIEVPSSEPPPVQPVRPRVPHGTSVSVS